MKKYNLLLTILIAMAVVGYTYFVICTTFVMVKYETDQQPLTDAIVQTEDYYFYANNLDLIEIIDTSKLTFEMLENRNGKLIIERCIGVVDNTETGDGHEFGTRSGYICYKSVEGIKEGSIVCTYFIYNPDNNYVDDIMLRFDYIIDN